MVLKETMRKCDLLERRGSRICDEFSSVSSRCCGYGGATRLGAFGCPACEPSKVEIA